MHTKVIATAALIGLAGAAQAQDSQSQTAQLQNARPESTREIGYAEGSLGFHALVEGNYDFALTQLQLSEASLADDPAHMINLGSAYAQLGRPDAAAVLFRAALESDENFDIVLANGEVMSTRDAARRALSNLRSEIAAR